ncbi:MAG: AlpA family transcriptional regulator [Pseudomonadota bacterium]
MQKEAEIQTLPTTRFPKIIRLPEVLDKTGLSRSSVFLKIKNGEFPSSIPLGTRARGWLDSEINGWIQGRASLR